MRVPKAFALTPLELGCHGERCACLSGLVTFDHLTLSTEECVNGKCSLTATDSYFLMHRLHLTVYSRLYRRAYTHACYDRRALSGLCEEDPKVGTATWRRDKPIEPGGQDN
ncbi:unnamed protein product [Protopolystoma xenopodis]|uniref:Uncharacterized protein n=1 Tax=Protopolystoma xenopodis TaxID=117903 RepID=A0A448WJT7_9PLAT|nr:unnamed protein product [Protopolystoma xenopodis]